MEGFYERFIKVEDDIYSQCKIAIPPNENTGSLQLDKGLDWVSEDTIMKNNLLIYIIQNMKCTIECF